MNVDAHGGCQTNLMMSQEWIHDGSRCLLTNALLTLGEIYTGLLSHSSAVSLDHATRVLDSAPGSEVFRSERPIAYVCGEPVLTGVDCLLPEATGRHVRCIGTVACQTSITGGRIVQSSSYVTIDADPGDPNRSWAHYLARPGWVETTARAQGGSIAEGFLASEERDDRLDIAAVGRRALDAVQDSLELDHQPPFKSARTHMRWFIGPVGRDGPSARFAVVDNTVRLATLTRHDVGVKDHVDFCRDLSLHDWLLTILMSLVDRSRIGTQSRHDVASRLTPAIDHLVHLWMPATKLHPSLAQTWLSLDQRHAMSRQWRVTVDRIRDQFSLAAWESQALVEGRTSRDATLPG